MLEPGAAVAERWVLGDAGRDGILPWKGRAERQHERAQRKKAEEESKNDNEPSRVSDVGEAVGADVGGEIETEVFVQAWRLVEAWLGRDVFL